MTLKLDHADDLKAELRALDATEWLLEQEFAAAIRSGDQAAADEAFAGITRVMVRRAEVFGRACLINAEAVSAAIN